MLFGVVCLSFIGKIRCFPFFPDSGNTVDNCRQPTVLVHPEAINVGLFYVYDQTAYFWPATLNS